MIGVGDKGFAFLGLARRILLAGLTSQQIIGLILLSASVLEAMMLASKKVRN